MQQSEIGLFCAILLHSFIMQFVCILLFEYPFPIQESKEGLGLMGLLKNMGCVWGGVVKKPM
jgi:hypothetical protein